MSESRTADEGLVPYKSDLDAVGFREAFRSGEIPVAVHGLGRMGLPIAAVLAEVTGAVTGVDVDREVVDAVEEGHSPVDEPGLDSLLDRLVADGSLAVQTDLAGVDARVHVVVVPTLLSRGNDPDLTNCFDACRTIGDDLSPGDLVLVESTVPPGTCAGWLDPILATRSGLDPGEYGLAHCPERTSSGRALRDIRGAYPRVVGGVDEASTTAARRVYEAITDNEIIPAPDARTAEVVKLFEGVYRDVNIGLANELAQVAGQLSVDVPGAIDLANTQPYCDLHDPGPGVGGHCIPYYPHFLSAAVDEELPLVRTARLINDGMPAHTVRRLSDLLRARGVDLGDATVALLGLTYRSDVPGTSESPARKIAGLLSTMGADVYGVDPFVESAGAFDLELVTESDLPAVSSQIDAIAVVTPHEAFDAMDWSTLDPILVLDCRAALSIDDTHHDVVTLGDGWTRQERRPVADPETGTTLDLGPRDWARTRPDGPDDEGGPAGRKWVEDDRLDGEEG